ncbi:hypothetical protein BDV25DRAFT_172264 [Aspergillus avenaceus]|uniref:HD/PDEase domain-containing protein n=1 Tax=Aspergillus avenaceus TaxID=36643 RepID=A0A5N6TVC4_ASPAV|nr:hypothetical protein BDV25DRAFT_172264 [Aspergillus avenaceus]
MEKYTTLQTFIQKTMSSHDPSHNPSHVTRVVNLAQRILTKETDLSPNSTLNTDVVVLAALLHDISDRKYLSHVKSIISELLSTSIPSSISTSTSNTTTSPSTSNTPSKKPIQDENETITAQNLVYHVLLAHGISADLAEKVQTVVSAVSYSTEKKDPGYVRAVLEMHSELGIVQDADRLDAIGAVGIGRCFTFLGAKGKEYCEDGRWEMGNAIEHFGEKLELLEGMMKTRSGREMARVRSERLREFRKWWEEEMSDSGF